jgi:hypothetical protein
MGGSPTKYGSHSILVVPSVGSPAEGRGWWDPQRSPRRFGHVYLLLFRIVLKKHRKISAEKPNTT